MSNVGREVDGKYSYLIVAPTNNAPGVVVCTSIYHGKTYTGKAICHPEDEFNPNIGKCYARERCQYRINKARMKHAIERYELISANYRELKNMLAEADANLEFAVDNFQESEKRLEALAKVLK